VSDDIVSERLALRLMPAAFLAATIAGRRDAAEAVLGLRVHPEWWAMTALAQRRLDGLARDPAYALWSLRAVTIGATGEMVGHAGFHTQPGPAYLRPWAPGGVEFGYAIYSTHRRRGYATEVAAAMIAWARTRHGVTRFALTIAPSNEPSRRIAQKLGFRTVGVHVDAVDGLEDIFVLSDASGP
jgi:RimJ/RimL family protein N-acetyltransferase